VTDKARLQQKIRERQIEARRQRLCSTCVSFYFQRCGHGLLPVTSDGSDCPYFQEKKRDNSGPEGAE